MNSIDWDKTISSQNLSATISAIFCSGGHGKTVLLALFQYVDRTGQHNDLRRYA
jgi:hypothetical protein